VLRWTIPSTFSSKKKTEPLVWIAAVGQLHTAAALVAELSEKYPGEYRVFDKRTGEMIPSNEPLQSGRGTLH
jgi:3-deoxy-D-manno-octulosonic-acid transferase